MFTPIDFTAVFISNLVFGAAYTAVSNVSMADSKESKSLEYFASASVRVIWGEAEVPVLLLPAALLRIFFSDVAISVTSVAFLPPLRACFALMLADWPVD